MNGIGNGLSVDTLKGFCGKQIDNTGFVSVLRSANSNGSDRIRVRERDRVCGKLNHLGLGFEAFALGLHRCQFLGLLGDQLLA